MLEASRYKRDAKSWQIKNKRAVARIEKIIAQCREKDARIRQLEQQIYGKRSEQSKGDSTSHQSGEFSDTQKKRGKQPGTPGFGRTPELQLPSVVGVEDFHDEKKKLCACCGKPFREFPGTDDSEEVQVEVKAYRRVIKRKRYQPTCQCPCNPGIITVPPPPKLIPKGKFGISFWVHVLINKYYLQRPLNRILEELRQHNLDLSAGSITGGLRKIAPLFTPIAEAIAAVNRSENHWHADETRWMVFVNIEGKHTHRWYLWVFQSKTTVVFKIMPTRGQVVPKEHFGEDAWGIISADRFSSYKALLKCGRFLIAFCWAHVRRDFLDCARGYEEFNAWAMQWVDRIGNLYHINNQRIQCGTGSQGFKELDADLRAAIHEVEETCQKELSQYQDEFISARRKILASLMEHWSGLILFVDQPWIPMDNNTAERTLRDSTVGRKGYYGSGAIWSAELMADTATTYNTLELWGINQTAWTEKYLQACAENGGRAPKDITPFLPWKMSNDELKALGADLSKLPKKLNSSQKETQKCAIAAENSQKKKCKSSGQLLPKGIPKKTENKSPKRCVFNSVGANPMAA